MATDIKGHFKEIWKKEEKKYIYIFTPTNLLLFEMTKYILDFIFSFDLTWIGFRTL